MRCLPCCLLLTAGVALAQPPAPAPTTGDLLINGYLRLETARLQERFLEGTATKEDWEARRGRLRDEYLDMLGLRPLPERTPLHAAVTGTVERETFKVEKLHFQSRPGLYVTANLYLPRPLPAAKLPAVLYVCGHSNQGRDGNKTGYQHHGIWFATHGYACLVLDTLQLGEIPGVHHGTYKEGRWWWQAAGYTPAGVECWNAIRGLDYLQSRPEVDPERIAATGRSGGGATTLWVAAADDRVKVAVPVSGMSDWQCHVSDQIIQGHCDCMFPINAYRWDFTTIAALIAPRPLLVLNSGHDAIFPMAGNERMRDKLERLYRLYAPKPETLFDVGVTPGGHKDNVALRLMAYRWINTHLKNDPAEVDEPPLPRIPNQELRVFPDDKDRPTDALNDRIDETFVPRAQAAIPDARGYQAWREGLLAQLRARVFHEWPEQVAPALEISHGDKGRILLATEPGMVVTAVEAKKADKPERFCLIVLGPDEPEDRIPAWAKPAKAGDSVYLLSPRGCGGLGWSPKKPPYVERSHALLGRTVDAGRVWDVQAVARWLHDADPKQTPIVVMGKGSAGVLGAYAALWEPCIDAVELVAPPASHKDGPIFLNVLRVLDVPEALGLLAPRSVTLTEARGREWERTAQIYQAAGAGGALRLGP